MTKSQSETAWRVQLPTHVSLRNAEGTIMRCHGVSGIDASLHLIQAFCCNIELASCVAGDLVSLFLRHKPDHARRAIPDITSAPCADNVIAEFVQKYFSNVHPIFPMLESHVFATRPIDVEHHFRLQAMVSKYINTFIDSWH